MISHVATISAGARRLDGIPKLRGETLFTQDLNPSGLLHIKLVLSSYPSATVNGVDARELSRFRVSSRFSPART